MYNHSKTSTARRATASAACPKQGRRVLWLTARQFVTQISCHWCANNVFASGCALAPRTSDCRVSQTMSTKQIMHPWTLPTRMLRAVPLAFPFRVSNAVPCPPICSAVNSGFRIALFGSCIGLARHSMPVETRR
jgi:hypothetical protein